MESGLIDPARLITPTSGASRFPAAASTATSYCELGAEDEEMRLLPLTVTESATPAPAEGADADATLD